MNAEHKMRSTRRPITLIAIFVVVAIGVGLLVRRPVKTAETPPDGEGNTMNTTQTVDTTTKEAIFAGGCFWCIESAFEAVPGVIEAISGYTGGSTENPSYEDVLTGTTGHFEAVLVQYDPQQITYKELLEHFWQNINPTDAGGQFYDRGSQYYTAIFYLDEEQQALAQASKRALEESGVFDEPIVTQIIPAQTFYIAEDYHQDYSEKYLAQYKVYERASGREGYLEKTWEGREDVSLLPSDTPPWEKFVNPSEEELRETLTSLQCSVTQDGGTELPFMNEYWDNHEEGIYVDVVSGEPLFLSTDKYDSGTGWPSFTRPIDPDSVVTHEDTTLGVVRIEIRSRYADSHLGHVFDDGPLPTGERYCVNSAALRFIPKGDLEEEGYGEYFRLFD